MTVEEAIYCMKVSVEEEVCENCQLYGETGTDHCYIDACRVVIETLEKHIPKKPHKYTAFDGIERNGCPRCFEELGRNEILYAGQRFCSVCGQAIGKK